MTDGIRNVLNGSLKDFPDIAVSLGRTYRMTFLDPDAPNPALGGGFRRKTGIPE